MPLRHLLILFGAYTIAFAIAWSATWVLCELHMVKRGDGLAARETSPVKSSGAETAGRPLPLMTGD